MHSTVRHKCIFILYAKRGSTSRHTLCLKQKRETEKRGGGILDLAKDATFGG